MTDAREHAFKTWFIKEVQAKLFTTFSEVIKEYDRLTASGELDNVREKWETLNPSLMGQHRQPSYFKQ